MYHCKVCDYQSASIKRYVNHTRIHSNLRTIPCGVPKCNRSLKSLNGFYSHVSRDHQAIRLNERCSQLGDIGVRVKCTAGICQQEVDFSDLRKHLNQHLREGVSVKCPATGCGRKMGKISTLHTFQQNIDEYVV